jgi:drug/metabolite transporter (DMT)-like permease
MLAVLSAMFTGLTAVLVKQLTATTIPTRSSFFTNMMLLPLSLVPALFVWTWPTAAVLPALIGMGVCAVLGHIALVRGYTVIDASLALTFEFSKLPFTVAIAYLVLRREDRRLDLGRRARHLRLRRLHHTRARPSSGARPP